jgi:NADH:ubiquinone oxidoreductase subunit F (NADH-binding)/(2Fe-2S) ferredoxin/NAD-dependent dihydropyrimidine dehydrogenase PreA subunit
MPSKIIHRYQELFDEANRQLEQENLAGKTVIQVGSATCENAAGARGVLKEFTKYVEASRRGDVAVHQVGCTGRCSCEPIVNVIEPGKFPVKYQRVDQEMVHRIFTQHIQDGQPLEEHVLDHGTTGPTQYEVYFCGGRQCRKQFPRDIRDALDEQIRQAEINPDRIEVITANCFGLCRQEVAGQATHMLVRPSKVMYRIHNEDELARVVNEHFKQGRIVEDLQVTDEPIAQRFFDLFGDVSFFNKQSRIALRNSGIIDPERLNEYLQYRGFEALAQVLDKNDPKWLIDEILASNLRGRGGGGYPTGRKWSAGREADSDEKFIICNADEGDPGAFMDRSMLEGDPLSVIEGMVIGGFAIGASQGYMYIRAEYPMAIRRVQNALTQAREKGLLGKNILDSGFDFDIEIRLGAGAFVCGEETALIHSIEGQRGQPRIRPPYPSTSGLWGKPTVINNVETLANIPVVIQYGAQWFSRLGTESSGGTKVFALAGKVNHTGLVEVPMGTTLREIVYDIGGGIPGGKALKAIQTGGPAGGCIPAQYVDTIVDFDSLRELGSIMGSGGMIVMDEDDCMVDIAKFFLTFSEDESCGKCTPCREGTTRMLEIIDRICEGKGEARDLVKLERLAKLLQKASLCGLGRAAPNPVLSTLQYFREEWEAHVVEKRCPARKCTGLVRYEIKPDKCVGCTLCARHCPVDCISGQLKKPHEIDQEICIKCGKCFQVCKFDAVSRT